MKHVCLLAGAMLAFALSLQAQITLGPALNLENYKYTLHTSRNDSLLLLFRNPTNIIHPGIISSKFVLIKNIDSVLTISKNDSFSISWGSRVGDFKSGNNMFIKYDIKQIDKINNKIDLYYKITNYIFNHSLIEDSISKRIVLENMNKKYRFSSRLIPYITDNKIRTLAITFDDHNGTFFIKLSNFDENNNLSTCITDSIEIERNNVYFYSSILNDKIIASAAYTPPTGMSSRAGKRYPKAEVLLYDTKRAVLKRTSVDAPGGLLFKQFITAYTDKQTILSLAVVSNAFIIQAISEQGDSLVQHQQQIIQYKDYPHATIFQAPMLGGQRHFMLNIINTHDGSGDMIISAADLIPKQTYTTRWIIGYTWLIRVSAYGEVRWCRLLPNKQKIYSSYPIFSSKSIYSSCSYMKDSTIHILYNTNIKNLDSLIQSGQRMPQPFTGMYDHNACIMETMITASGQVTHRVVMTPEEVQKTWMLLHVEAGVLRQTDDHIYLLLTGKAKSVTVMGDRVRIAEVPHGK